MSIEEHPYANAVGLMFDLAESIKKYRRGDALKLPDTVILELSQNVAEFIHRMLECEVIMNEVKVNEEKEDRPKQI